ncbi:NAD(P)/FAD-dependent oxidoreductase [Pseudaquabacterium pictum]|uniref:NAD(FAD)-utilizing dehydrogenase n=1 Tax=Pseudaquabacterium pictum TaxID=2315236 RepID=A0A480B342_9BURK|nr:TIGR03862 family flavoprotein [Rubrivivax pictus]GCL66325.1 NAD(FAD)-utilizing dehydrogenase [Rubrivivax pictus]
MSDARSAISPASPPAPLQVAIVGGGPAGLMAAEALLQGGAQVDLYDGMPSVGRKFLLAGKGGLNLTHSEPLEAFTGRYAERAAQVAPWLEALSPQALRDWAAGLGIRTFVGSSGRVFPAEMKAAPLLRAWLHRLRVAGLRLHMRHRWQGWQPGDAPTLLRFDTPSGPQLQQADAVLLALGGASWARLGSDGAWVPHLAARGVDVAPLQPANCGFDVGWSPYFSQRFAGAPMKSVRLHFDDGQGPAFDRPGEFVITATGIEGSLVYAASARLRAAIARQGQATLQVDLLPGRSVAQLAAALAKGRGARSLPNHLKEHAGLDGVKAALLREALSATQLADLVAQAPQDLAARLKAWPITVVAPRPIDEAISTAGGVRFEALDGHGMLRALPGVFVAGEMLDWEAPTGGYLLSACCASGLAAARGLLAWHAAGGRAESNPET